MLKNGTIALLSILCSCLIAGCATSTKADWRTPKECFARIKLGQYEKIINDSKSILSDDRWNADAHACLVMAYYQGDKKQLAIKRLREAADTIPKEHVDRVHDILWDYTPEFLAEREYIENYPINGGDCLLRNVKALKGNGFLIIGRFYDPKESKTVRHITGYRCSNAIDRCSDIDLTCPECELREPEAIIVINDYRISDIQHLLTDRPIIRNVRYINKVLEIESGR
jgi:hypothetical protein